MPAAPFSANLHKILISQHFFFCVGHDDNRAQRSFLRWVLVKPILRWAGSKRSSLPNLVPFWTDDLQRYIEPFCGSAALFFCLEVGTATLSDLNRDLINFYSVLRSDPTGLHTAVLQFPRDRDSYYALRETFNATSDMATRAALFYYLNKNCFNGLFRTALDGKFNVPFSGVRTGDYPQPESFLASANLLWNVSLCCGDFEKVVVRSLSDRCLVYLDPPYANGSRQPFAAYHPNSFAPRDLDRLEALLDKIDKAGSIFLLSYSSDPDVARRFARWNSATHVVRRNIAGFAGARKLTAERVFTNQNFSHA